jgi:Predicted membrane protein
MIDPMGLSQAWSNMFSLPVPLVEKLIRPMIVYIVLVLLLRLFGKRELAQLNPFDLVVLLSLSNTVQNAIIGNDNSVTGGVVGAFALLAVNWLVARVLFRSRRLTHALEGRASVLVRNGKLNDAALKRESLTVEDLMSALHRQGFGGLEQVALCELEPNGTFYVEAVVPSSAEKHHEEILARLDALSVEISRLRLPQPPTQAPGR